MLNIHYAISAVLLFCTMAVLLFVFGGEWVRVTVIWALWVGGVAQFIAQDDNVEAKMVGLVMSYFSMLLGFAALIVFTVRLAYN